MKTGLTRAERNLIRALYTRHGRRKHNLAVCEGLRACREALAALPGRVELVAVAPEVRARLDFELPETAVEVPLEEFGDFTATVTPPGILAVLRPPEYDDAVGGGEFILALDRVADPGNFGTVLRTARAAGLDGVWFTRGSADPWSDKVIRSALGAHFAMRLAEFADLDELLERAAGRGFDRVWISDPGEGESCFTAPGLFERSVVVIGNEANGVAAEAPGRRVTIPMPGGFESLNAAQAATVLLFEYVRRKEK